ncbi:MAG: hypothetical protein WBH99_08640 [Azovibrio sp.]|uniref:hypothetical protein n=1 Tax=Azovibrio sp. TaxID=1872673 RepID=UPI003C7273D8
MTFKLQPRLMLAMAASSLLSVLIVMVIAIQLGTQVVEQDIERKIQETLNARHAALSEYLLHFRRDAHLLARDPLLAEALRDFTQAFAQQGKKAQLQLQQAWISRNPYPAAQRQELTEGDRKSNRMSTSIAHVWGVSGMHTGDCWVDFSKPVARDFSV